ncbi:hypothetical protein ACF0H5_011958 [Mactra antiquata]
MDTVGDNDKRDVRRPMNAFLIFCKRHRSIVREKNPDLDNRSVTRILGDLWANLKDEEKVVYTDLAKQYKDAFMKANPDYKWHNPEKAVTCPKTGVQLSKPTNAKVMKSEMNLLTEGSIMPGKLADPCNMGGLSLLLMAGEQQSNLDNRENTITSLSNTFPTTDSMRFSLKQNISTDLTAVHNQEMDHSHHRVDTKVEVKTEEFNKVTSGMVSDTKTVITSENMEDKLLSSNIERTPVDGKMNFTNEHESIVNRSTVVPTSSVLLTDTAIRKPLLYQAMTAPKLPTKCLLADSLKDYLEMGNNSDILKDNSVSTQRSNVENQSYVTEPRNRSEKDTKMVCKMDEKENISEKFVTDIVKEDNSIKDDAKDDESPMVTCGKLVVNHIIDRLYSSGLATAGRKNVELDKAGNDGSTNDKNVMTKVEAEPDDIPMKLEGDAERDVNSDVPKDGDTDKIDASEICKIKVENFPESCMEQEMTGVNSAESLAIDGTSNKKTGKFKSFVASGKGEDSTENEDVDDYQPVRKSRRRNRGQRYQELINEGIIQLSKERMAALQQPTKKEESPDEDVETMEGYNSYILPETAIRRIRKRTTSESAKDKILTHDDMKRYKTGDFDLEAQIATLPACSVENMGRKRGFARQRHNSECIHTQRKLSDIDSFSSPHQVFNAEKIVTLPPHIKLMSETSQVPVVGSRKRKARKHSITHMVPAPATLIKNGKVKSDSDCLGPCLIKPGETPVNDQNQTTSSTGLHSAVTVETDKCDHSICINNSKMPSDCDTVSFNKSEPVKCDNSSVLDCVQKQTGCEKCESSDTDSTGKNGTQSDNSVNHAEGAQNEASFTVSQSEDKLAKELSQSGDKLTMEMNQSGDNLTMEMIETSSVVDTSSKVGNKTESSCVALEADVVTSEQIESGSDDHCMSILKNAKDVNCNNTIKNK